MKNFFILFVLLFLAVTEAMAWEPVQILARIKSVDNQYRIVKSDGSASVSASLKEKELIEVIKNLNPGDEALIEGFITYETKIWEGRSEFTPVFIIEAIRPISLSRLGKIEVKEEASFTTDFSPQANNYEPLTIPISAGAASAITLSASALMMSSLTANENQPKAQHNINNGLIFSAGVLATGFFIYEQIYRPRNKGKKP
jgi:hypothetical protein